jgi:hypothetical protein
LRSLSRAIRSTIGGGSGGWRRLLRLCVTHALGFTRCACFSSCGGNDSGSRSSLGLVSLSTGVTTRRRAVQHHGLCRRRRSGSGSGSGCSSV